MEHKFDECPPQVFTEYCKAMNELACSDKWPLPNKCGRVDCQHWRWDRCDCEPGVNTPCHGCD